jgi:hypothetical protein
MADSDPFPSAPCFPEWQTQYEAALLETDSDKLPKFVVAAEAAIFSRLQALAGKADHGEERQAMSDALHALRYLKGSISPK